MRAGTTMLDERFKTMRLGEAERAVFVYERRALANAASNRPYRRTTSREFLEETARVTGYSIATLYRDLRRADELGCALLNQIKGTSLDTGAELDALIDLSSKRRHELVDRAAAGEKVSAKYKGGRK